MKKYLFLLLLFPMCAQSQYIEMLVATNGTVHTDRPKAKWTQADWDEFAAGNIQTGYVLDARTEAELKARPWGDMEKHPSQFVILRVPEVDFDSSLLYSSGTLKRVKRIPLESFLSSQQLSDVNGIPYGDFSPRPSISVTLDKHMLSSIVKDITDIKSLPPSLSLHGSSGTFYIPTNYSSIYNAVAAQACNASADVIFYVTGVVWETARVDVTGYTTYATSQIIIQATGDARHAGIFSNQKQMITTKNTEALRIIEDYVLVDGLQIRRSYESASGAVIETLGQNANNRVQFSNNIVIWGVTSGYYARGYYASDADAKNYVHNNIFYCTTNEASSNYGSRINNVGYLYNNLWYDSYGIVNDTANAVIAKNNICINLNNDNAWSGTFGVGSDNNTTNTTDVMTTGSGGSNITEGNPTFTDTANGDFHPTADTDIDNATDCSLDLINPFTNDVDGNARTTWYRGPFEYGVVESTPTPTSTPTATPTATPTNTPTSTPTVTPTFGGAIWFGTDW